MESMGGRSAPEPKRRGGVSDVGADADHVEIEGAEGEDVFGEALEGLAGNADHDAATGFVAQLLIVRSSVRRSGAPGKRLG